MTGLLMAGALLGAGFLSGYAVRAWISHRRRVKARRARGEIDGASSMVF